VYYLNAILTLDTLFLTLVMGAIYALISMGLGIQLIAAKTLNVSVGEFVMVGACMTWGLAQVGISPIWALLLCSPFMLILGYALHRLLFKRIKRISGSSTIFENKAMLLTFGVLFIIQDNSARVWGTMEMYYPFLLMPINIGRGFFPANLLFVFVLAAVIVGLAYFLYKKVSGGQAKSACDGQEVNADKKLAVVSYVMKYIKPGSKTRTSLFFAIGLMFAGVSGVLLSMISPVHTGMGMGHGIAAMIAITIGGLGSLRGSLIGGFALGVVGALVSVVEPSLQLVVFYMIFMAMLIIIPLRWRGVVHRRRGG